MFFAIICIILSMAFQDSFLGIVLFAVGMFSLVSSVASAVNKMEASKTNVNHENLSEKTCPPHKWEPDAQNFLRCLICKKRPGEIHTEYDKPY